MRPRRVRASYARQIARMFLESLGLDGPPIPVYEVACSMAHIEFFRNPEVDPGYTVRLPEGGFLIAINFTGTFERMSWTICHEIAHIELLHHEQFGGIKLTREEERILDREADIFTRELLMPEKWIRERTIPYFLDRDDLIRLKRAFRVSWEALFIRLEELQIIEDREAAKALLANERCS